MSSLIFVWEMIPRKLGLNQREHTRAPFVWTKPSQLQIPSEREGEQKSSIVESPPEPGIMSKILW